MTAPHVRLYLRSPPLIVAFTRLYHSLPHRHHQAWSLMEVSHHGSSPTLNQTFVLLLHTSLLHPTLWLTTQHIRWMLFAHIPFQGPPPPAPRRLWIHIPNPDLFLMVPQYRLVLPSRYLSDQNNAAVLLMTHSQRRKSRPKITQPPQQWLLVHRPIQATYPWTTNLMTLTLVNIVDTLQPVRRQGKVPQPPDLFNHWEQPLRRLLLSPQKRLLSPSHPQSPWLQIRWKQPLHRFTMRADVPQWQKSQERELYHWPDHGLNQMTPSSQLWNKIPVLVHPGRALEQDLAVILSYANWDGRSSNAPMQKVASMVLSSQKLKTNWLSQNGQKRENIVLCSQVEMLCLASVSTTCISPAHMSCCNFWLFLVWIFDAT